MCQNGTSLRRAPATPKRPARRPRDMDVSDPHGLPRRLVVAEAVVAHLPDPVVLVDASGFVQGANAAARALLPTLAVGRPLSYGLRAPEVLDAVAAARPGGTLKVEYAPRVPTERTFEVQITPPLEAEGETGAGPMMLLFRDLTQARRV